MKLMKFGLIKRLGAAFCVAAALLSALALSSCENDLLYIKSGGMSEVKGKFENIVEFSYEENGDGSDQIGASRGTFDFVVHDGDIYFDVRDGGRRYSPETGKFSSICPDPLCTHNTPECPFYGSISDLIFVGDKVIYEQSYSYMVGDEWLGSATGRAMYDFSSGKYKMLYEVDDLSGVGNTAHDDKYFYCTRRVPNEDGTEWNEVLCIVDIETCEVRDFNRVYIPQMIRDGKLLAVGDFDDDTWYLIDPVTMEAEETEPPEFIGVDCGDFYIMCQDGQLKRYGKDSSDVTVLAEENVTNFYVTNDYIYYLAYAGKVEIKMPGGGNIYQGGSVDHPISRDISVTAVYRMRHDGSGLEEVWRTDTENGSHLMFLRGLTVIKRYIYADFNWFDYDAEHDVWISDNSHGNILVRIDTETGEEYFLDMGK